MTKTSKKHLDERLKNEAWAMIEKEIGKGTNSGSALKKFFTQKELGMLEKRLTILVLLAKGKSYLSIRRELDVSPGTVSFIKHGFKINKLPRRQSGMNLEKRTKRKYPRHKGSGGLGLAGC